MARVKKIGKNGVFPGLIWRSFFTYPFVGTDTRRRKRAWYRSRRHLVK